MSLGFYTTPLSALVAIGHGIYVIGTQGIRTSKLVAYLLASFVGVLTYIPWIIVVANNIAASSSTTEWASRKIPPFQTVASFLINIIIIFLDIPSKFLWKAPPDTYQVTDIFIGILSLPILFLIGFSIFFLYRHPKEVWLFVLTLIAVTSLTFLVPDLLLGGIRSVMPRFQIPVLLGIELAVAYLLATKISVPPIRQQKLWQIAMLALISSGVISCTISSQSDLWWNKYFNTDNLPISRIVNQSKSPLLISDARSTSSFLTILSISHVLEPKVKIQLLPPVKSSTNIPKIANNFTDVFLLTPSKELREGIEKQQNFQVESVYDGSKLNPVKSDIFLWKLLKSVATGASVHNFF